MSQPKSFDWFRILLPLVLFAIVWFRFYGNPSKPNAKPETVPPARIVDEVTGIEVDGDTVIMLSMEGCSWCQKWKNEEQPKFDEAQIDTHVVDTIERPGYPVFRMWNGFQWKEHVGFMTFEEFRNGDLNQTQASARVTLVSSLNAKPEPEPAKPAPQPVKAPAPAKTVAQLKPAAPAKTVSIPAPATKPVSDVVSIDPVSGFHVSKPTVIVLSKDGCGPCITWERDVAPTIRSKDVDVFSTKLVVQKSYPTFRIYDGKGRWHTRAGSKTTATEILGLISK
jgi:hypothetical protein